MDRIYIDIETIPGQAPWVRDEVADKVKPPATLKKAESIQAWHDNEKAAAVEEAWQRTGLDGTYGQVICVRWAADDGDVGGSYCQSLDLKDEAALLEFLWKDMHEIHSGTSHMKPVLVGHNIAGFDLPFLWRRSVVHGLRPPLWWPKNPKPWSDAVYDTMLQWSASDRDRISLDRLCKALGLPGKGDGPTGADVWPMAQRGEFAAISDYCAADVERTRALHKRMVFAS